LIGIHVLFEGVIAVLLKNISSKCYFC